jgi:hypothetical protein
LAPRSGMQSHNAQALYPPRCSFPPHLYFFSLPRTTPGRFCLRLACSAVSAELGIAFEHGVNAQAPYPPCFFLPPRLYFFYPRVRGSPSLFFQLRHQPLLLFHVLHSAPLPPALAPSLIPVASTPPPQAASNAVKPCSGTLCHLDQVGGPRLGIARWGTPAQAPV